MGAGIDSLKNEMAKQVPTQLLYFLLNSNRERRTVGVEEHEHHRATYTHDSYQIELDVLKEPTFLL